MLADSEPISPLAQTVPLSSEGLTTSTLSTDETGRPAPETRRVRQSEMEHLLSRSRFDAGRDGKEDDGGSASGDSAYAAPQTGEITKGASKPHAGASPPSAQMRSRAANQQRSRRSWILLTSLLLLATLSGALVAYYLLRQRASESAGETPVVSNGNQAAEQTPVATADAANANTADSNAAESESAPPPEEKPAASVKPSIEAQTAREERARLERERKAEAETPAPPASPTPASSPSITAQSSPTPAPSPAASATNGTTPQQPQGTSDAFYFQAVNLVNGREPRTLKRAELLRAIQLFQNVKSGPHAAEAAREASRLGKELDRQNRQSQR